MVLSLNLAAKDEAKQELFNNLDFRIGLSHAINRDEIISAVYQGVGEPWQAAPRPESVFYDEDFAKQYTEFDTDLAEQHLDAAGLTERDQNGMRLGSTDEPVRIVVDVPTHIEPHWVGSLELVRQYWAEVGVEMSIKQESRPLFDQRLQANDHEAGVVATQQMEMYRELTRTPEPDEQAAIMKQVLAMASRSSTPWGSRWNRSATAS